MNVTIIIFLILNILTQFMVMDVISKAYKEIDENGKNNRSNERYFLEIIEYLEEKIKKLEKEIEEKEKER